MREIACLKIVIPGFISFSEGELAGNYISNPGSDVVMYPKIGPWLKRELGGDSYFEFTIELSQVAEKNLIKFDHRRDASCSTFS